jgi:rhamnose utilization protein RhaD (predicted bifunctional aldolase and dehydrogenase)/NAD(P)-dependent dehydrogenase (short-subunit alcohol dehydrogenase family)
MPIGAQEALDDIVTYSRLLGERSDLVLHGGGNTSIKATVIDIFGDPTEVVYVKGSGWNLANIEAAGFVPLRSDRLARVLSLDSISDSAMMNELRLASLDSKAPDPSVESLLHSFLPAIAVVHSHADAIVTVSNLIDGEARARELFGSRLVIVPYTMPGFNLAKAASELWAAESTSDSLGILLLNHGLVTIGDTAKEAYERHIALVTEAERYGECVASTTASPPVFDALSLPSERTSLSIASLRTAVSAAAGVPMILTRSSDDVVAAFVSRGDLATVASQGPLTPEHSIRTKRIPLIGRDVTGYVANYLSYVDANGPGNGRAVTPLSPEPRVILDSQLGLLTAGHTAKDAAITADIYHHTIDVITKASRISEYRALPASAIFNVEYWELEQAKLAREIDQLPFRGEVAIVTGAASGIGRACAEAFLAAGAAVVGLDRDPRVREIFTGANWLGVPADVTDSEAMRVAIHAGVDHFGGVDILVMAAGIFAASEPIAELDLASWRRSMAVNADSAVALLQMTHPFLKIAPRGGRVVLIGTKNVAAPGPGAAAYSASKTAAAQLARVAALEWADDSIRVNMCHPDAVFDTALWSPELIAARAARYGMTEDEYKARNLLHAEVTSARVASMVQTMCTDIFSCTTGAQVPVDGGNDRVI